MSAGKPAYAGIYVSACPRTAVHIPESQGTVGGGLPTVRDRGNWPKARPMVHRWTNGAGWVNSTSYEVVRVKAVHHEPMNRPKGTLSLQGGEEVRESLASYPQRALRTSFG